MLMVAMIAVQMSIVDSLTDGVIRAGEVAGAVAAVAALVGMAWRILRRLVAILDRAEETCTRLGSLEAAVAALAARVDSHLDGVARAADQ